MAAPGGPVELAREVDAGEAQDEGHLRNKGTLMSRSSYSRRMTANDLAHFKVLLENHAEEIRVRWPGSAVPQLHLRGIER